MKLYVNCITSGAELRNDIKTLIPEMNLRRRMSRVVKSGVAAGIESLLAFGDRAPVDAVVTATGLGCIADSEKFLDALIANEEQMLNPTPFIQSTFNTVGAQIALLRGLHCYNTTYAHRWTSFENALTDAALRIGAGLSQAVLVGAFDETTPSVEKILQRLRVAPQGHWGESAVFFVLTARAFDTSVAAITQIRIPADDTAPECCFTTQGDSEGTEGRGSRETAPDVPAGTADDMRTETRQACRAGEPEPRTEPKTDDGGESGGIREVYASETGAAPHFTAIAEAFRLAIAANAGRRIVLYNDFAGGKASAIELICM